MPDMRIIVKEEPEIHHLLRVLHHHLLTTKALHLLISCLPKVTCLLIFHPLKIFRLLKIQCRFKIEILRLLNALQPSKI